MQADPTDNPKVMVLKLSPDEAAQIGNLIDRFVVWDVMGSETIETFLVEFGRSCREARSNERCENALAIRSGQIQMSPLQIQVLGEFLSASVKAMGDKLGYTERTFFSLTAKTLRNNVQAHLQQHGLLRGIVAKQPFWPSREKTRSAFAY
ncbi:MAG: hypothetical protein AAF557_07795 [Pseudomonadota bacterium]